MTPQGIRQIANNLNRYPQPGVTRCPKCQSDVPHDRMLMVTEPSPAVGILWHGCMDCLARADARFAVSDDIPVTARSLIRRLWHYLTMQRPTQGEVDAIAVEVQRALRGAP